MRIALQVITLIVLALLASVIVFAVTAPSRLDAQPIEAPSKSSR